MEPNDRMLAKLKAGCICKGVRRIRIVDAVEGGAATVEEVQQRLGIGDGSCRGKRCGEIIAKILAGGSI